MSGDHPPQAQTHPRPRRRRRRRRQSSTQPQPQAQAQSRVETEDVVCVYGNDTTSTTRMFPEPAAATCTTPELWAPKRLHGLSSWVEEDPDPTL